MGAENSLVILQTREDIVYYAEYGKWNGTWKFWKSWVAPNEPYDQEKKNYFDRPDAYA